MTETTIFVLKSDFKKNKVISSEFIHFQNFSLFKKYINEMNIFFKENDLHCEDTVTIDETFFSFENKNNEEKITFEIFFSSLDFNPNQKIYILHITKDLDKEGIYDSIFLFEDSKSVKFEFENQKSYFVEELSQSSNDIGTLDDTETYYSLRSDDDYFHFEIIEIAAN